MNGLLQDLRYALRQWQKNSGFAATAIIVLALGIGATTGMLAIVRSVLVRPLNYHDADRVMLVGLSSEANATSNISHADFREMQRSLHQFEQLGAYSNMPVPVQTADGSQMLVAPAVTTNFFEMLGVRPVLGRSFREGEDAPGGGMAVVSHEFWQHSMHGDRGVIGSKLRVNGDLYTVIGVMPPHFQFPMQIETLWTALQLNPQQKTKQGLDTFSVGRLKRGATVEQARSEGEAFFRHRPSGGSSAEASHFWVYPYKSLVTGNEKSALLALLAACVVLLLIAVVNAANLQIARATRRETEIAMRAALGATRKRLLRQLVVESLLLSCAGAALGWVLAIGFVQVARHLFGGFARFDELRLDLWTFAGCLLLTSIAGVAASLAPAWHLLKKGRELSVQHSAGGRASRPQRLSGALVTAEVALTCILLIAAGLFLRTFRALQNVPLGFVPDHVSTFLLWPQSGDIPLTEERAVFGRLLDRLEHLQGVEAAGMVTSLPISNFQMTISGTFSIPGHLAAGQKGAPQMRMLAVSPGYFRAMQIPILAGHSLTSADTHGTQLFGVVNQTFVEKCLHGVNPIGQQIVLDKDAEFPQPITIIGVSGDVIQGNGIGSPIQPEVAISYEPLPSSSMLTHFLIGVAASFAVRSKGDSQGMARDIRNVVKSEAPEFAIDHLVTMNEAVQSTLGTRRLAVEITSAFAWIALLLSAAGLYGVLAYLVGQRAREIGIRLALGASRENVFALVFRQGLWMVGGGLVLGWLGALFVSRWIRSFLFGTAAHDPATYVVVGALIVVASAVAMFLPARRAASIEPMEALRTE